MKDEKKLRIGLMTDLLIIGGWVLVSSGTLLLNISAGLIVSGTLAICGGILLGRGNNG